MKCWGAMQDQRLLYITSTCFFSLQKKKKSLSEHVQLSYLPQRAILSRRGYRYNDRWQRAPLGLRFNWPRASQKSFTTMDHFSFPPSVWHCTGKTWDFAHDLTMHQRCTNTPHEQYILNYGESCFKYHYNHDYFSLQTKFVLLFFSWDC